MKTSQWLGGLISFAGLSVLCVFLMGAQNVGAQENNESNKRGQLSPADYKFVCEALKGGRMEVSLGQLAMQKGADPGIRDFGDRMVRDHSKANDELTQLIAQKGGMPPDNTGKQMESENHLKTLTGGDFDRTYIKDMVRDHEKVVKEFQGEADKADDPELKNWVSKTLPTVQDHLAMAQKVEAQVVPAK